MSSSPPASSNISRAKPRAWRWPLIVVGLLSAHVAAMVSAVVIISQRGGESAIIPDYYNQAQSWDLYRQRMAQSQQLGWNLLLEPTGQKDAAGHRMVRMNLADQAGRPISNAQISVHCFHLSHGDEATTIIAQGAGPGSYTLALPVKYSGFWQFETDVTAGGREFIAKSTQWIN